MKTIASGVALGEREGLFRRSLGSVAAEVVEKDLEHDAWNLDVTARASVAFFAVGGVGDVGHGFGGVEVVGCAFEHAGREEDFCDEVAAAGEVGG